MQSAKWRIEDDLDSIIHRTRPDLLRLDGQKLFLTGGTGFIGRWFLELLLRAAQQGIKVETHVLSRNPEAFAERAPHLVSPPGVHLHKGEITTFSMPGIGNAHVIHGAAEASAKLNAESPGVMFDTIVLGTRHLLRQVESQASRVMMLSSGAVYGRQPSELIGVPENWEGGPDCTNPLNAYAEAKRAAEMLCGIHHKQTQTHVTIARIFAVLGPMLPLGSHFAAGNFISDAISGRTIIINGDGRAVRSYLYPTDMLSQLLAILVRGQTGGAYNVGSEEAVSIRELAERVSDNLGQVGVKVLGRRDEGWNPGRYVPNMSRMRDELSVAVAENLDQMILNTARYNGFN